MSRKIVSPSWARPAHPTALTDRVAEEIHHGVGEAVSAANAHHHRAGDAVYGYEVGSRLQRVNGGQLLYVVRVDLCALSDEPLPDVVGAVFVAGRQSVVP